MRKYSLLVLALGFALTACRDGGNNGDDTPFPDAPNNSDQTIQDVQNDSMAAGTKVNLKGVVVVAIDRFGAKKGDFWAEEPGGGAFSGVQVYGAPIDQVAALSVGDVIDITGAQKAEFALSADTSGNTLTELEPVDGGTMTVTKISSGTAPDPVVVDALAIGQMTDFMARAAEWEKWEGVLIKLDNVQSFSSTTCIKSMGNCPDPTYERFDITGDIQVQSALAAMPTTKIGFGDCLSSVTGVMTYFFDYQILPRETTEIGTGGTSCPHENMSALCGDSIDNDGNGFSDCADNACVVASATCRMKEDATIPQVQDETPANSLAGKYIKIPNVFVTAVSFDKTDVWLSTSATAASGNGLQAHFAFKVPTSVVPGKKVTVIGKVLEFNDNPPMGTGTLTELQAYDIQVDAAAAATVTPVSGQTLATLTTDITAEPYEGVLVTLSNIKLVALGTDASFYVGDMRQGPATGGTTFKFDDAIYRFKTSGTTDVRAAGDCFQTITGIWSYQVYDNYWIFFPIDAGDITGGTCP